MPRASEGGSIGCLTKVRRLPARQHHAKRRFESRLVGLHIPNCELFAGRSESKELDRTTHPCTNWKGLQMKPFPACRRVAIHSLLSRPHSHEEDACSHYHRFRTETGVGTGRREDCRANQYYNSRTGPSKNLHVQVPLGPVGKGTGPGYLCKPAEIIVNLTVTSVRRYDS